MVQKIPQDDDFGGSSPRANPRAPESYTPPAKNGFFSRNKKAILIVVGLIILGLLIAFATGHAPVGM